MSYGSRSVQSADYSTKHLINDAMFEPQHTNNAYIHFDLSKLKSIYGKELAAAESDYTAGAATGGNKGSSFKYDATNILRIALDTFDMPGQTNETIVIRVVNDTIKFAGGTTYNDIDVSLTDWLGADSEYLVASWDGLRYNPRTHKMGRAYQYKLDGWIVQYSPDGTLKRNWKLVGCFIDNVKYGSYRRSESGSERKISFTLHIDQAYPYKRIGDDQ